MILCFCTSEIFSILGVDPTFRIWRYRDHLPLLATSVTYTNRRTITRKVGPHVYLHEKDFTAYHFFTSTLVGQRQQLSSLKAFGNDSELALENALKVTFPMAQHVRCFLHFCGNVERKLCELNVPNTTSSDIIRDIMDCPTQLQLGLVDAENALQMDGMLKQFESRWNERMWKSQAWITSFTVLYERGRI